MSNKYNYTNIGLPHNPDQTFQVEYHSTHVQKKLKCECGAAAIGFVHRGNTHSTFCPMFIDESLLIDPSVLKKEQL